MKITTAVYGAVSSLALCAALASPAHASCDGPFVSVKALLGCWAAEATHPTEVYVDGNKVGALAGTGFSVARQYFLCNDGSGVKKLCAVGQQFGLALQHAAQDGYPRSFDAFRIVGPGFTQILDGVVVSAPASPLGLISVTSCHGDQSFNGPVLYFIVDAIHDGFGQLSSNTCFQ